MKQAKRVKRRIESEISKINRTLRRKKSITDIIGMILMLIAIWYMCRDLYHAGEFDSIIEFVTK